MRESDFIRQNKDKWQEFEHILDQAERDPEQLSELFVQVTDDLSYSRTFYPNRSVRVYLNDLAQRVFLRLYRNRPSPFGRFLVFWTDELPLLIYDSRRAFQLSFGVFVLAFAIGVLSSAMDPEFANVVLGDDYVDMTLENIESGDPMAVYKQRGRFGMSFGITLNNLYVAFLTFVLGVFFAIGSLAILIQNGVMVGAFQYFFVERDLFQESFLTIWTHGTLELSAIIMAGAAGITMGQGLLYPGPRSRIRAFQDSARRGLKIMIGISPIFLLAGFIEGYLTRQTGTPDGVRLLFIGVCLAFVLLYFVWYPRMRGRLRPDRLPAEELRPGHRSRPIDYERIHSSGELFANTTLIFRRYALRILGLCFATSLAFLGAGLLRGPAGLSEGFSFPYSFFSTLETVDQFFVNAALPWLPLLNLLLYGILAIAVHRMVIRDREGEDYHAQPIWKSALFCLPGLAVMQLILLSQAWYTLFLALLLFPIPMLWIMVVQAEHKNPLQAIGRTFSLLSGQYARCLSLFLTLAIFGLLLYSVIDTVIFWFFLDLLGWVIQLDAETTATLSIALLVLSSSFLLHVVACMLFAGMALLYYTLLEILEAGALRESIQQIGRKRRIRGLEREL